MAPLIIYVAGFRQHAGKTITSLGLLSSLQKYLPAEKIGYIKPVGQELVELVDGKQVDKDALIIEKFGGIPDIDIDCISPVRLGSGFTKTFLDTPDRKEQTRELKEKIEKAFKKLAHKEVIIAEGTGHPGVGGIVGWSNADVCNLINADIIYLSGGGIGKALDMLEVDFSYFKYKQNRMRGIIFNKLIPDKVDTVKKYITEELLNEHFRFPDKLRIFGYFPEIDDLYKPSMIVLKKQFIDSTALGNVESDAWTSPCSNIRVISLAWKYLNPARYLKENTVVLIAITSRSTINNLIKYNRQHFSRKEYSGMHGIGGIILTCGDSFSLDKPLKKALAESGIPTLIVQTDTATAEKIILNCFENTKLQLYDAYKIHEIHDLFENHFDIEKFIDTFKLKKR
ncbi:MAG: AAA family ATPase [Spirochaetales bacterium]|nr:AAA family ATPase [Spirochaetales bacterium]